MYCHGLKCIDVIIKLFLFIIIIINMHYTISPAAYEKPVLTLVLVTSNSHVKQRAYIAIPVPSI